ncbi:ferritin-like domain-containing protein [Ramlibacter algicola]|uniref:Ferritin-like domain-containing protein n=1 Tax=Ramlibacter algicola TaxID=2795217 RepID=A0A934Q0T9_9BURK|nr:ferritin-like domain-containing protein [Ramlibacter algicola]MBK0392658.1 ferritin-like domain-containing protein [Ramlibacter algicola]
MQTLRRAALAVLLESDPGRKAELARALDRSMPAGADEALDEPPGLPGRPARPELVPHTQLQQRSIRTIEGRAALLHSIAHIELNAIDLAADAVWRYPGQPAQFYVDWALVAHEEGLHFQLLREHLRSLGFDYGDFPAHNGLWEMAQKTRGDLLARLALVPRTLEARGLDASPAVKAKLVGAGDHRAGEILDVILRDEIGHVAIGNRWFEAECAARGLEPVRTAAELAARYGAPRPRGPFNLAARRAAGFSDQELDQLAATPAAR